MGGICGRSFDKGEGLAAGLPIDGRNCSRSYYRWEGRAVGLVTGGMAF